MLSFKNLLGLASGFDFSSAIIIVAIICLLIMSAFFSSCEIAFSSSNHVRIKTFAEENKKGARKALYILDHFDNALSAILVGNNFVNILSTTLCAYLLVKFIQDPILYNILNTVVMTIVILIFGEILPKAKAKTNPENVALKLAPILFWVIKITYIFCLPFNFMQKSFSKKTKTKKDPTITEDELEDIVEKMEDEGVLDEQNADIIFGALKFNDVAVKDIMTPRVDVVCANIINSVEEIKKIFLKNQYSRIPVYKRSKDNIIGILNQKDFFSAIIDKEKINIEKMLTSPLFVSKNTKINVVMRLMQKEKKHLAIVSDEYGGTSGIVTMEDCFEEVFGEVYDEHDETDSKKIVKIDDNTYKLNADLSVEELFDYLGIEKKPKNKYVNLNSFLNDLSKKIPQQDLVITYKVIDEKLNEESIFEKREICLSFKLTLVEKRRIKEVELSIKTTNKNKENF